MVKQISLYSEWPRSYLKYIMLYVEKLTPVRYTQYLVALIYDYILGRIFNYVRGGVLIVYSMIILLIEYAF